jgi:hypothetical protein
LWRTVFSPPSGNDNSEESHCCPLGIAEQGDVAHLDRGVLAHREGVSQNSPDTERSAAGAGGSAFAVNDLFAVVEGVIMRRWSPRA